MTGSRRARPPGRETALREVLLVKAIEEADRAGALIPFGDRERAAREALRSAGIGAAEAAQSPLPAAVERALADRASRLAQPLLGRHPVLGDLLLRARPPAWPGVILLAAAFAAGSGLAALDGSRRINILAPPFLGLLLWNLLVYLSLAIGAARRIVAGARAAGPVARSVARGVARRLGPLLARTAQVDTVLGEAVRGFAADWAENAAPLLGRHLRRWLHLGAAAVAAGLIAGLYLRGIVLRYEAGWESTFLEPPQVRTLIELLFGRLASWAGIALPRTLEQVAQLRWDGVGGGGGCGRPLDPPDRALPGGLRRAAAARARGVRVARGPADAAGRAPACRHRGVRPGRPRRRRAGGAGRGQRDAVRLRAAAGMLGSAGRAALPRVRQRRPCGAARGDRLRRRERPPGGLRRRCAPRRGPRAADEPGLDARDREPRRGDRRGARSRPARAPGAAPAGRPRRGRVRRALPGRAAATGRLEERRRLWRDFVGGYGVEVAFSPEADAPAARGA